MKLKAIQLLLVPATLMLLLAGCNSSSSTDYFQKGSDYLDQGDYHQAIQEYDEAIRLDPDDADAYYNRGLAYLNLGQYEKAAQDRQKYEELKSTTTGGSHLAQMTPMPK